MGCQWIFSTLWFFFFTRTTGGNTYKFELHVTLFIVNVAQVTEPIASRPAMENISQKAHTRNPSRWKLLGCKLHSGLICAAWIIHDKLSQQNPSQQKVVEEQGRPQSESCSKVRFWKVNGAPWGAKAAHGNGLHITGQNRFLESLESKFETAFIARYGCVGGKWSGWFVTEFSITVSFYHFISE